MIRIAIVVCCAALAAAEAEADPAVFYRSYGHHGLYQPGYNTYTTGYTTGYPSAVRAYAGPLTTSYSGYHGYQAAPATVGSYQPYGYAASGRYFANSVGAVHIAKREAEAEPEADPAVVYGHNGLYNTVYNTAYPTAYTTGFPALRAYSAPVHHGYSLGYRNFIQPSYYSGHYY